LFLETAVNLSSSLVVCSTISREPNPNPEPKCNRPQKSAGRWWV